MTENRYGHAIQPYAQYGTATAKLRSMDRALREEIISNAQRQYEAAARELRLKAQAETQVQAQTQLQTRRQSYVPAPGHPMQGRPVQSHWRAQGLSQVRAYAGPHMRTLSAQGRRYSPQVFPPRSAPSAQSPSPNTPSQMVYRFRAAPKQTGKSTVADAGRVQDESKLELDELKRRYDAQVFTQLVPRARPQGSYYQIPRQASGSIVIRRPNIQYGRISPSGQTRTMADEYLDYYMPARRGPHSVPSQLRNREVSYSPNRRNIPEQLYRQEVRHWVPSYMPEASDQNEAPRKPAQSVRSEQTLKSPFPGSKEPEIHPQSSKGKLAFVLNPEEPGSSRASPRQKWMDETDRKKSPGVDWHSSSPHAADAQQSDTRTRMQSKDAPQDVLYASYSRPAKRKTPVAPDAPDRSDAASDDEAPRAKRRAFVRLPEEYDSQSELEPEEEETDEGYVAELSLYNKTRSRIRHNAERSATDANIRAELKPSTAQRKSHSENNAVNRMPRVSTSSADNAMRKTRTGSEYDGDSETRTPCVTEVPKKPDTESSSSSEEECRKYDLRPRAKSHSM